MSGLEASELDRARLRDLIRARRKELGYGQEELSALAGLTKTYVYKVERENRMPGYSATLALARVLGLTPEELFPVDGSLPESEA